MNVDYWYDPAEGAEELSDEDGRRSRGQRNVLLGLACGDGVELWHTPGREPWGTVPVGDHLENYPVRSKGGDFRRWLAGRYYASSGGAPGGQVMEDALRVVEMMALNGPEYPVFVRLGERGGSIFLDLGDATWRVVEITARDWTVQRRSAVKFARNAAMRALPEPEGGESVDVLRPFINAASEGDFKMLIGWVVGTYRPRGPYSILILSGEQGTGKSGLANLLRDLIDPRVGGLRPLPRDERDLAVGAHNSWVLCYDNLSGIDGWRSDAFCRLASGGGFATRELHSDREEIVIAAQRPLILNGITDLASRPDLADRSLAVALRPIPRQERRPQSQIEADLASVLPLALGAILDGVSAALRCLPEVRLSSYERMADFQMWVTAAESGLGWPAGSFSDAYMANRQSALAVSIESDPVATAVRDAIEAGIELEGSASDLLSILEARVSQRVRDSRSWPGSPQRLGNALMRAASVLRQAGYEVERKHSGGRLWIIRKPPAR